MSHSHIPILLSIHDIMPETLGKVLAIVERLESKRLAPIYLLVVPGCDWADSQLQSLKELAQNGHIIAGHGWTHKAENIRGLKHRLHSRFISRNVAEHLALNAEGIAKLIRRNHTWFQKHDFEPPALYVPPAWAMGKISRPTLRDLPFRYYEYLGGIYDSETDRLRRLPVIGYEADTTIRGFLLRVTNAVNHGMRGIQRRPIRLAIHPHDFDLSLADHLNAFISRDLCPVLIPEITSFKDNA